MGLADAPALLNERRERNTAERTMVDLTAEPRGAVFKAILRAGIERWVTAMLVIRDHMDLAPPARQLLTELARFVIEQTTASEWPGTRLFGGDEARVTHYELDEHSAQLLGSAGSGLYSWVQPDLLEDLCLLRPDGTPWLVTIGHEQDAYFDISEGERHELVEEVPELGRLLKVPQ